MPNPTADTYIAASGVTLQGGRGTPPVLGVPAWLAAMPVMSWRQIGTNAITGVNPASDPAINPNYPSTPPWQGGDALAGAPSTWSGGCIDDDRGRFWFTGGGHAGYQGNETYGFDYLVDAPAWVRHGYPSGSIQKPIVGAIDAAGSDPSLLTDERPAQVHSYGLLAVHPATGDLLLAGGGARHLLGAGAAGQIGYRFRRDIDDWDISVPIMQWTGNPEAFGGGTVYDPIRGVLWLFNGRGLSSINPVTGVATMRYYNTAIDNGSRWGLVHDTNRDLILGFTSYQAGSPFSGKSAFIFDPAALTITLYVLNVTGFGDAGFHGLAFDVEGDRLVRWNGGANLDILTPPASSPLTSPWTLSTITPSSSTYLPPAAPSRGTYGKFRISTRLNCVLLLNEDGNQKLMACRLR